MTGAIRQGSSSSNSSRESWVSIKIIFVSRPARFRNRRSGPLPQLTRIKSLQPSGSSAKKSGRVDIERMKWVTDITGRFLRRPHYLPDELDAECEYIISSFLKDRHGRIEFPIRTDDLTVLIERDVADLDIYADLLEEGNETEGETEFFKNEKPSVKISKALSEDPRMENRFRTTLTHEYGHVKFHAFLFATEEAPSLF